MAVPVVRTLLVQCLPNLIGHGSAEHVEDLVPLVAGAEETHGGLPNLGRFVVPELRRDYLVYRDVQTDIDRLATNVDLTAVFAERLHELRMLVTDHKRPRVGIGQIVERQVQSGERRRSATKRRLSAGHCCGREDIDTLSPKPRSTEDQNRLPRVCAMPPSHARRPRPASATFVGRLSSRMTHANQGRLEQRLREILWSCAWMRTALEAAREVAAPEWLIGAGAVRRLVWDRLHGVDEPPVPDDIDLVFYDAVSLAPEREDAVRKALIERVPHLQWDVKNQAAVHLWYQDVFGVDVAPLKSAEDGVGTWPETASAVAVRLTTGGALRLVAPLGLDDLFGLIWRRNPRRVTLAEYQRRLENKFSPERWPRATVASEPETT